MSVTFLIGAGASKGHGKPEAPLGNKLGGCLRKHYPAFENIEKQTQSRCEDDFEEWTKSIGDDGEAFTLSLIVTGHFFRRFNPISQDSLYFKLIDSIPPGKLASTSFISLNYESLLEQAIRHRNYSIDWGSTDLIYDYFNFPCPRKPIKVLKPHGSANFIATGAHMFEAGSVVIDITSNLKAGTVVIDPTSEHSSKAYLPVISAYEKEKRSPFNAHFIDEIRSNTLSTAETTDTLVIIGVRFTPEDKFLPSIYEKLPKGCRILYIGSEDDFKGYQQEYSDHFVVEHVSCFFTANSAEKLSNMLWS